MSGEYIINSLQQFQELMDAKKELIGETGNHVNRVAEFSYLIALKLGFTQEEADIIKIASPLHDIGKLGIPYSILNKPGKLTNEEYEIMKLHTKIGYGQLENSSNKFLKAAAIIAHQHHEKWNGKGYPCGLSGEDIHVYGRITAIADVFDALSNIRVYKQAWDLDKILSLIKQEKGQQFDPKIVDIFMELLPNILIIQDQFSD